MHIEEQVEDYVKSNHYKIYDWSVKTYDGSLIAEIVIELKPEYEFSEDESYFERMLTLEIGDRKLVPEITKSCGDLWDFNTAIMVRRSVYN
eukprot:1252926-Amorphochlora_amoeboformis.AAC.1